MVSDFRADGKDLFDGRQNRLGNEGRTVGSLFDPASKHAVQSFGIETSLMETVLDRFGSNHVVPERKPGAWDFSKENAGNRASKLWSKPPRRSSSLLLGPQRAIFEIGRLPHRPVWTDPLCKRREQAKCSHELAKVRFATIFLQRFTSELHIGRRDGTIQDSRDESHFAAPRPRRRRVSPSSVPRFGGGPCLNLENISSIGVRSGLYGGRSMTCAPAPSMDFVTSAPRCALRLSNTTTSPSCSSGTKTCST
jgi:hypothetical protein